METKVGRTSNVLAPLINRPQVFEFFQAVRLIKKYLQFQKKDGKLLFKSNQSLNYPISDLLSVNFSESNDLSVEQFELLVSFLGLTGQNAILPEHYTELLLERIGKKDFGLQAFLDIFHHRFIENFYTIWEKGRFFIAYEQNRASAINQGCLSQIHAISGQAKLNSDAISTDEVSLFYSGLLSNRARPLESLKLMLTDFFEVPVSIYNYIPKWVNIHDAERTYLLADVKSNHHNQLGVDTIIGKRVCHVQNHFEIEIGPLDYKQFLSLLPSGEMLRKFREIVKSFVGIEHDFHFSLILKKKEVPMLGLSKCNIKRLGWNSWLKTKSALKDDASINLYKKSVEWI